MNCTSRLAYFIRSPHLPQGAITRSTAGWDVKADDYTDDFMDDDSAAGPETHHGDDVARAEGKTEAATDG